MWPVRFPLTRDRAGHVRLPPAYGGCVEPGIRGEWAVRRCRQRQRCAAARRSGRRAPVDRRCWGGGCNPFRVPFCGIAVIEPRPGW